MEARDRFLNPEALALPRQLNPNISPRVERAILAAMALHPNDRPDLVKDFMTLLTSNRSAAQRRKTMLLEQLTLKKVVRMAPERYLLLAAALMLVISLIVTLGA